jgi:PAS domain S-box-containing protein
VSDGFDGGEPEIDFEVLVSAMGDAVYALDADGDIIELNDALARISGYDMAEIREDWPELLYPDAEMERFRDAISEMHRSGEPTTVDATIDGADGPVPVEVMMTPLPTDDGSYRGHVGIVRDVTDRRRRERELEEYETIVQAMPDEVYTLDAEGRFTSIVPASGSETTQAGYRPDEVIGEHVEIVLEDAAIEHAEEVIRNLLGDDDRIKETFETELKASDGDSTPVEIHLALLPTAHEDGFRGTVGVVRDVTEQRARQEVRERQNERLEEFANVVSHDLRNPLNLAMGNVDLLQDEYDDGRLDSVAAAHERMATIIEDVLASTREGDIVQETSRVSLAAVADAAWSTAGNARATIEVVDDVALRADVDRLQRLLENLYRNAIDHGGETVFVTVEPIDADGEPVGFAVADDGPGIPPDDRERVFESGYTRSSDGTGLGLAIVKRIAEAHGWTVAATEGPTGGARFEFTGVEME